MAGRKLENSTPLYVRLTCLFTIGQLLGGGICASLCVSAFHRQLQYSWLLGVHTGGLWAMAILLVLMPMSCLCLFSLALFTDPRRSIDVYDKTDESALLLAHRLRLQRSIHRSHVVLGAVLACLAVLTVTHHNRIRSTMRQNMVAMTTAFYDVKSAGEAARQLNMLQMQEQCCGLYRDADAEGNPIEAWYDVGNDVHLTSPATNDSLIDDVPAPPPLRTLRRVPTSCCTHKSCKTAWPNDKGDVQNDEGLQAGEAGPESIYDDKDCVTAYVDRLWKEQLLPITAALSLLCVSNLGAAAAGFAVSTGLERALRKRKTT